MKGDVSGKSSKNFKKAGAVVHQRVGSAASSEEGAAPTPPAVPEHAMAGVAPTVQAGEVIHQQLPEGADAPIAPVIEDVHAVATQDEDSAKKPRARIVASSNGVSGLGLRGQCFSWIEWRKKSQPERGRPWGREAKGRVGKGSKGQGVVWCAWSAAALPGASSSPGGGHMLATSNTSPSSFAGARDGEAVLRAL